MTSVEHREGDCAARGTEVLALGAPVPSRRPGSAFRRTLRFAGHSSRPHVGAEPSFETGDRGEIRPRAAGENVADHAVIDSRDASGLPVAALPDGLTEAKCEQSGDLGDWVDARGAWPLGTRGFGRGPDRPGHASSVEPAVALPLVHTGEPVTAVRDDVGKNLRTFGAAVVTHRIDTFTPEIKGAYWEIVGPFVRAAVADAQPKTPYAAKELLSVVTRLAVWAWQSAGLELERSVVFDPLVIEEFVVKVCHGSPATKGNHRSKLLRVAEALLGSKAHTRLTPFPPSDPVWPYSRAELTSLRWWARGQATPARTKSASALLALGAGAGLAAEDIEHLTAGMVTHDATGVLVSVP